MTQKKHCVNCGYPKDVVYFEAEDNAFCRACLSLPDPFDKTVATMESHEFINCIRNAVRQVISEKIPETTALPEIRKMTQFMLENFHGDIKPGESAIDTAIRMLQQYKEVLDERAKRRRPTG